MPLLAYFQIDPSFVNILDASYNICTSKLLPDGLKLSLRCLEHWIQQSHFSDSVISPLMFPLSSLLCATQLPLKALHMRWLRVQKEVGRDPG